MELDRRSAELLFQVLTEREERNSDAMASNESIGGRTKTFTAQGDQTYGVVVVTACRPRRVRIGALSAEAST